MNVRDSITLVHELKLNLYYLKQLVDAANGGICHL